MPRRLWMCPLIPLALAATPAAPAGIPTALRGPALLLLKPDLGPLSITVEKRDLNIYEGDDELTAQLFDPHRRLLAEVSIPEADGPGDERAGYQQATLNAECRLPGVYALAVSVFSRNDLVYGIRTNCPKCVVQGLPLFNNAERRLKVCFEPPTGAFKVIASSLHQPGRHQVPLLAGDGKTVHTFDLTTLGEEQTYEGPAERAPGLWHLDIAKPDVKLALPGVTFWTTDPNAYFQPQQTRWMLRPYSFTRYLQPRRTGTFPYTLRNTLDERAEFRLEADAEASATCRIVSPGPTVALDKGETAEVLVEVQAPPQAKLGAELDGQLIATCANDAEVRTSAGLVVRVGESPLSQNLALPIVHQRYRHENAQFGYAPDYVCNEVYFDRDNRAFIRERGERRYPTKGITYLDGGTWHERSFVPALTEAFPTFKGTYFGAGFVGAKIAFDGDNDAYTLLSLILGDGRRPTALLHTADRGDSWSVHELPRGGLDLEQFTGHNTLDIPPPVLIYKHTKDHPATFCSYNDLLLYLPKKTAGGLDLGEPVLVSDACLGSCQHSGGPASTATRDGKTHIVWGEVTEDDDPGVPCYVATYDHATGKLGEKVFLAYAPPVNDVHNVPGICLDSEGYLHAITGAHGAPFKYRRSLKPNDAYSGWTESVEVLSAGAVNEDTDADGDGRQTYLSLVCDQNDTLHIAFRQWRSNVDPYHNGRLYAALSIQSKPKGKPWGPARPVVVPPVSGYSIYYHKLTTDRRGRLFLSYSYYTADTTYQNDFPYRYNHRAVLTSADGGVNWKLAETKDFAP